MSVIVTLCIEAPPPINHLDALISTFVYRQLRLDKLNFLIGDNCIAIV